MAKLNIATILELNRPEFLDSDLVRLKTGGVTIDAAAVPADANGKKVLLAGYPVGLDPDTGKYVPAARASVVLGSVESKTAIKFEAKHTGTSGNSISVELVDPGAASQELAVSVDGTKITVSLGTDGDGNIVSTAADVVDAVNGDADAAALVTASLYGSGNDGSGVVSAVAETGLSGGKDAQFLLLEDVDVTEGDAEAAVMDWGRVKSWALPYEVDDGLKALLSGITFA